MSSHQSLARLTGVLYLLVIILAGFSQGYVRGTLFVPGDAGATAANITAADGLFRLGLATDLTAFLLDAVISVLLYQLLRPVDRTLAITAGAFRLLAHPAIGSLNLLNHYMAAEVLRGGASLTGFDADQLHDLALLLLTAHQKGYLIAGAFFGVHCLLLGILLHRSPLFPKILGWGMGLAAAGYLIESFGNVLFPDNESGLALVVGITAAIGEVGLTAYLLVKGVRMAAGGG